MANQVDMQLQRSIAAYRYVVRASTEKRGITMRTIAYAFSDVDQ